jgi:hypothetical protein
MPQLECKMNFALQDTLWGQTGVNRNPIDPQKIAVNRYKICDVISLRCGNMISICWAKMKITNQAERYFSQTCSKTHREKNHGKIERRKNHVSTKKLQNPLLFIRCSLAAVGNSKCPGENRT